MGEQASGGRGHSAEETNTVALDERMDFPKKKLARTPVAGVGLRETPVQGHGFPWVLPQEL